MKNKREQMEAIVFEWHNSGLSKKAFCRERAIAYQTFQYWCKRLAQHGSVGFAEVQITAHSTAGGCEVIFPSGVRLIFSQPPSAAWLHELVR